MSAIKELAAEVLLQAVKDYLKVLDDTLTETDESEEEILNDLQSDWMMFLTDGTSIIVAEKLKSNPEEIKSRMGGNQ